MARLGGQGARAFGSEIFHQCIIFRKTAFLELFKLFFDKILKIFVTHFPVISREQPLRNFGYFSFPHYFYIPDLLTPRAPPTPERRVSRRNTVFSNMSGNWKNNVFFSVFQGETGLFLQKCGCKTVFISSVFHPEKHIFFFLFSFF